MSKQKRKPSNKSSKGRKPFPRQMESSDKRDGSNDPKWYTRNGQLTRDAFNLPFTWPTGRTLPIDYLPTIAENFSNITSVTNQTPSVPGIMSLKLAIFPGKSMDENSAINVASRNLYSYVRHANSGHSNYDAPDLMMYIMAMDSLYSMYEWGRRVYGTLAIAAQTNRYYPKALVEAQGFNYDDLLEHIVDLRAFLNIAAIKLSSLCVPRSMSLIERHRFLFSSIYRDANEPKAQLYLYTPAHFFKYIETEGAGYLQGGYPDYSAGAVTFAAYVRAFNDRINAVMGSEDMNIMSGDVLKAFGEGNLEKLEQIPENYVVIPMFDEQVLYQMRNATLVGAKGTDTNAWDVLQDTTTGALICNPQFQIASAADIKPGYNRILSAPNSTPTPEEVAEFSRLAVMSVASEGSGEFHLDSFASDIAVDAWVWWLGSDGNVAHAAFTHAVNNAGTNQGLLSARIAQFKHHPAVLMWTGSAFSGTEARIEGTNFEYDNYTVVDRNSLTTMHEAALLSMFSIPEYGAWDVGVASK